MAADQEYDIEVDKAIKDISFFVASLKMTLAGIKSKEEVKEYHKQCGEAFGRAISRSYIKTISLKDDGDKVFIDYITAFLRFLETAGFEKDIAYIVISTEVEWKEEETKHKGTILHLVAKHNHYKSCYYLCQLATAMGHRFYVNKVKSKETGTALDCAVRHGAIKSMFTLMTKNEADIRRVRTCQLENYPFPKELLEDSTSMTLLRMAFEANAKHHRFDRLLNEKERDLDEAQVVVAQDLTCLTILKKRKTETSKKFKSLFSTGTRSAPTQATRKQQAVLLKQLQNLRKDQELMEKSLVVHRDVFERIEYHYQALENQFTSTKRFRDESLLCLLTLLGCGI